VTFLLWLLTTHEGFSRYIGTPPEGGVAYFSTKAQGLSFCKYMYTIQHLNGTE